MKANSMGRGLVSTACYSISLKVIDKLIDIIYLGVVLKLSEIQTLAFQAMEIPYPRNQILFFETRTILII